MSDAVIIAGIGGVVSLASLAMTLLIKSNVDKYHKEVDGMKTELVEAVRGKAQAEGEIKGAKDNQEKTDSKDQDKK